MEEDYDPQHITPADGWWAVYQTSTGFERLPLAVWWFAAGSGIEGAVAVQGKTRLTVADAHPSFKDEFYGYYRSGERVCTHHDPSGPAPRADIGDPTWCRTCAAEAPSRA